MVRTPQTGRYLRADEANGLVVGATIAERLSAGVDDEVVATAVGMDGTIQSALFRIVGVVNTGSEEADSGVCQVRIEDLTHLTGLPGAGEVSVVLDDYREVESIRAALASRVAPGDDVLTMIELAPEIEGHFQQDAASSRFVSAVILLIVLLGVASAQLTSVLERRREFAVLSALGMSGSRMVQLVLQEGLMVGVAGAALALVLGVPLVWQLARSGLDFRGYLGSSYSFQGMLFDPVIYGDFGVWIVTYVFVVAIVATVLASVYPAWYAARTNPATALRVAQ